VPHLTQALAGPAVIVVPAEHRGVGLGIATAVRVRKTVRYLLLALVRPEIVAWFSERHRSGVTFSVIDASGRALTDAPLPEALRASGLEGSGRLLRVGDRLVAIHPLQQARMALVTMGPAELAPPVWHAWYWYLSLGVLLLVAGATLLVPRRGRKGR
jgi:hypothetical protein